MLECLRCFIVLLFKGFWPFASSAVMCISVCLLVCLKVLSVEYDVMPTWLLWKLIFLRRQIKTLIDWLRTPFFIIHNHLLLLAVPLYNSRLFSPNMFLILGNLLLAYFSTLSVKLYPYVVLFISLFLIFTIRTPVSQVIIWIIFKRWACIN